MKRLLAVILWMPPLMATPLLVDIKTVETDRLPKLHPRLIHEADRTPASASARCYLIADTANDGVATGIRLTSDDLVIWQGSLSGQIPVFRPGCFAGYGIAVNRSLSTGPLFLLVIDPVAGRAGEYAVGVTRLGTLSVPELGNPMLYIQSDVILQRQATRPVGEVGGVAGNEPGGFGDHPEPPSGTAIAHGPLFISRLAGQEGAVVRFPTTWGVHYTLESKPFTDAPSWEPLGFILGDGGEAEIFVELEDQPR